MKRHEQALKVEDEIVHPNDMAQTMLTGDKNPTTENVPFNPLGEERQLDKMPVVHELRIKNHTDASNFTVLVPIANPASIESLIPPAVNAALRHRGKILLLHVIVVPDIMGLSAGKKYLKTGKELTERALNKVRELGGEAEVEIRLAHRLSTVIIESVVEHKADLLVMGWKGQKNDKSISVGQKADYIMAEVNCDVLAVQQSKPPFENVLLPIADLEQIKPMLRNAALFIGKDYQLDIVHFFSDRDPVQQRKNYMKKLDEAVEDVRDDFPQVGQWISVKSKISNNIVESIVTASIDYTAVIIGATRASWIKRRFHFDKPSRIAQRLNRPIILISPRENRLSFGFRKFLRYWSNSVQKDQRGKESEDVDAGPNDKNTEKSSGKTRHFIHFLASGLIFIASLVLMHFSHNDPLAMGLGSLGLFVSGIWFIQRWVKRQSRNR